jgi:hypothetical protein
MGKRVFKKYCEESVVFTVYVELSLHISVVPAEKTCTATGD